MRIDILTLNKRVSNKLFVEDKMEVNKVCTCYKMNRLIYDLLTISDTSTMKP